MLLCGDFTLTAKQDNFKKILQLILHKVCSLRQLLLLWLSTWIIEQMLLIPLPLLPI
ncbi:hypothetical protein Nmel_014281 [Mimus melanotis]